MSSQLCANTDTQHAGVLYIATGPRHAAEACESASSVKRWMPGLHISVFSDVAFQTPDVDRWIIIENAARRMIDKVRYLPSSPYERTIYLDADTYVCGDICELFSLLEKFDLAAAHAPYRAVYRVSGVPDCFPELNCGVLVFRRSEGVRRLFGRWLEIYQQAMRSEIQWLHPAQNSLMHGDLNDQPAFREAVYLSDLRIATLTPEYNCRFQFPGYLHTGVKVLHGRSTNVGRVLAELNASTLPRVHRMTLGRIKMTSRSVPTQRLIDQLRWSLSQRGIVRSAGVAIKRLMGS
jgi:hypothetical protein